MGLSVSKLAGAAIGVVLFTSAPAQAQSITDKLGNWLFGPSSAPADANNPANTVAEVDCPGVTVRQGASTLSITAPGAHAGPMTTRYQVSIAQTARECAPLGGEMTMKVGVEGRVLLGPAGGPGQIDVPLRMAVVQEGPNPKTIVSKFYRLADGVSPGGTTRPPVHVAEGPPVPAPAPAGFYPHLVFFGVRPHYPNH